MKPVLYLLVVCTLYSCSNKETKHLVKRLNNGVTIDVSVRGEDVGLNDVSYMRDITLKKRNKEVKLDLGKSQWPGGYVLFHSFKISNSERTRLMVFFNYYYDDNVFKIVDPKTLILIEDTAILNQVKKVGHLPGDKIYWGDFEEQVR